MPLIVVNGPVIGQGEALSDGVDVSFGQVIRITCPYEWTSANISFQISSDGNGYNSLYDARGEEVVIPCGPQRAIVLDWSSTAWKAIAFLKIRSGSEAHPVLQKERREFAVAVWTDKPLEAPIAEGSYAIR